MKTAILHFLLCLFSTLPISADDGFFSPQDQRIEIGKFEKLIQRTHHSDFEKELIRKAERTPFNQHLARRLLIERLEKYGKNRAEVDMNAEEIWAINSFDGILTAIAITEKSIQYYSDIFDALREGNDPLREEGFLRKNAYFKYTAHVEKTQQDYQDGSSKLFNIVMMKLSWSTSSQWLHLNRQVIFDEDGNLIIVIESIGGGLTVS
jgi:hypothetical protein